VLVSFERWPFWATVITLQKKAQAKKVAKTKKVVGCHL
jgi:hypothetical protein